MNTLAKSQKPPKAKERKMDCELTSVSHGSHDDSHDSLARTLSRPLCLPQFLVKVGRGKINWILIN